MKTILTMLVVGGLIFGASAAASWFLRQRQQASVSEGGGDSGSHEKGGDAQLAEHAGTAKAPQAGKSGAPHPHSTPGDAGLPAAVRPKPVSVEELLRYSLGLKSREETLAHREKDMDRKQAQVSIVLADIQGEQRELDGLRAQVKEQLASVELMLGKVAEERQQLESERAKAATDLEQLKNSQSESDATQRDNVKQMSAWFQSMEPEKAATVLQKLSNDGKMDLAIQLLSNFEEREASKILSAIEDTTLTVELAEAFRTFKKPSKKVEARR